MTTVFLLIAWLVPPFIHRIEHLCPLRPEPVRSASALPSFSRRYGYSCTQCHVAYPVLNDFGRRFLLNGFSAGEEGAMESGDKQLWFEKLFPWGIIIRSRPFDNGKGSVSNMGGWAGSSDGANGFKSQPLNDADFFVAGGDAARHVSWLAELDANSLGNFVPNMGDMQLGYHPSPYLNFILARKNFFAMDPYQTLSSMMSPTIQPRATDGMMQDQNSLSGNFMTEQTMTTAVYGSVEPGVGSLFYMGGVTTANNDNLGRSSKNGIARLAFDTGKGLVLGAFGAFGHETPVSIPVNGGNPNAAALNADGTTDGVTRVEFMKTGFDALVEAGNWVGRGAFVYSKDNPTHYDRLNDPLGINGFSPARDRSAYAEVMYVFKRSGSDLPFLLPLLRENWYTTYNNTRQFNYLTMHLAHYFTSNVKAFVECSVDTKTDFQGTPQPLTAWPFYRVAKGNRVSGQIEVGF